MTTEYVHPCPTTGERGKTLRDWFAGQATESDISPYIPDNLEIICKMIGVPVGEYSYTEHYIPFRCAAKYRYADAMLKAREKQPDGEGQPDAHP